MRNKRKHAAHNKENCEEHPTSKMAQNSTVPRSQEDHTTQVFEEIEGRVTKGLSQEFSRAESRILGALFRLDDFLLNTLIQGHSGIAPETSRNTLSTNQGTNEDDSLSDPHSKAGVSQRQTTLNSSPGDAYHIVTGVQEETPFCSPGTSSGNQKKAHSKFLPQYRSENTPTTSETDQTLLALQQLASNKNSANFNQHYQKFKTAQIPHDNNAHV